MVSDFWLMRKNSAPSLSGSHGTGREMRTEIASSAATPVATAGHSATPTRQGRRPTPLSVRYDAAVATVGNITTLAGVFVSSARARASFLLAIGA